MVNTQIPQPNRAKDAYGWRKDYLEGGGWYFGYVRFLAK